MTDFEIALKAVQLYAEMHPRPPHVTQAQAAEMLHRSEPTVRKLIRSGIIRLNAAGLNFVDAEILQNADGAPARNRVLITINLLQVAWGIFG